MEIQTFLRPLLKWWWLIVSATLIATVSSFLVTRQQPSVYQSRTTLVTGQSVFESNPSGGDFYLNQQLASFYADIAQREVVRNATMEALGLAWLPEYIAAPVPNSQMIEIVVSDINPARAQAVANELANQLILQTPTSDREEQDRQAFLAEQLSLLEVKIIETQDEITRMQAQLADLFSARELADAQVEISALETKLSALQTNYATLLANSTGGAGNTLSVIDPANLPTRPVGPNVMMIVMLSSAVAFVIAAMAAYLLEYLDDTLKSPEDVTQLLDIPVLGHIPEIDNNNEQDAYVARQPRSIVAEAFRSLRTDLEFARVDWPLQSIYISSAGVDAGKTSIAVNLAVVMAQGGKKVVLVDADLRKPSVHRTLGISNNIGLSDVFRGTDLNDVMVHWVDGNIDVITCGEIPPNPSELLGSKKMDQILDSLRERADVVIIDGPPFVVTDATILASKVDGVLLVIRYGNTRKNAALTSVEQLRRSGARILGAVLNCIPNKSRDKYKYYSYYYGEEQEGTADSRNGKPKFFKIFKTKTTTSTEKVEVEESGDD